MGTPNVPHSGIAPRTDTRDESRVVVVEQQAGATSHPGPFFRSAGHALLRKKGRQQRSPELERWQATVPKRKGGGNRLCLGSAVTHASLALTHPCEREPAVGPAHLEMGVGWSFVRSSTPNSAAQRRRSWSPRHASFRIQRRARTSEAFGMRYRLGSSWALRSPSEVTRCLTGCEPPRSTSLSGTAC